MSQSIICGSLNRVFTGTSAVPSKVSALTSKVGRVALNVIKSPEFWVLAKGVAITAVILTALFFLGSNPVGWSVTALAVSMLVLLAIAAVASGAVNDRMNAISGITPEFEKSYHSAFLSPTRTPLLEAAINDRNSSHLTDYLDAPITFAAGVASCAIYFATEITRAGLSIPFWLADCVEIKIRKNISSAYSWITGKEQKTENKIKTYVERLWVQLKGVSLTSKHIAVNGMHVIKGEKYRRFTHLFNIDYELKTGKKLTKLDDLKRDVLFHKRAAAAAETDHDINLHVAKAAELKAKAKEIARDLNIQVKDGDFEISEQSASDILFEDDDDLQISSMSVSHIPIPEEVDDESSVNLSNNSENSFRNFFDLSYRSQVSED